MKKSNYWLVVWNKGTGDYKNVKMNAIESDNVVEVSEKFEGEYPDWRVIHIGDGEVPPKTYRSLDYLK